MDDSTLKALLSAKITNSLGYFGGQIAQDRLRALEYYNGDKFGNEVEGRSQVVSLDVAEVIDSVMPSLMRIFTSGDEVVIYEPTKPEDEKGVEQATDYANWVWQQNNGYAVYADWFKDALLNGLGVIKTWWQVEKKSTVEHYSGLNELEYQVLKADPDVKIIEEEIYSAPELEALTGQPAMLYDCEIRRTKESGCIRIKPVPPEEFLTEKRVVALDNETVFCAHRVKKTRSELIEEGYDEEKVNSIPTGDEAEYDMERLERFREEDNLPFRDTGLFDKSTEEIWITECYLLIDYDGDGIAERRKITVGGDTGMVILDNEEVDDHPFSAITPIKMPHKLIGKSLSDRAMDIQLIKSTLWRQGLDNLYLANNSRMGVVDGQVNLDDMLTSRPGGLIRMKAPGMIEPVEVPNVAGNALSMIEYTDSVREKRTGVVPGVQGIDSATLSKMGNMPVMGVAMMQQNDHIEMIARTFAETGVREAFRKILKLACRHQNEVQMIKLRGQWVPMDPRGWSPDYGVTVNVGFGTGNKHANAQLMMQLLQLDAQIVQLQGGANGPLLTMENIYNKVKTLVEMSGRKNVDAYYTDPSHAPQQQKPQQPDPKLIAEQQKTQQAQIKAQAQVQAAQIKAQSQIANNQQDAQQAVNELEMRHIMDLDTLHETLSADIAKMVAQANLDNQAAIAESFRQMNERLGHVQSQA